ncbi:MAG: hypothetical protein K6348_03470, partial [Deferribacterales bacterium]
MKKLMALILVVALMTISCAPDPFKESFENAKKLESANKLEEAYAIYKDLCQKVPQNKEYCEQYSKLNQLLFNKKYSELVDKITYLKSKTPLLPITELQQLENDAKKLYGYSIDKVKVDTLISQISNEKTLSEVKKNNILKEAEQMLSKGEYSKSIRLLKENEYLDISVFNVK